MKKIVILKLAFDCDDLNPVAHSSMDDADCDGYVAADDCDDNDPLSNNIGNDGDCDGLLKGEDCNDDYPNTDDQDCDGYNLSTGDDCDDSDASIVPETDGVCAIGESCAAILDEGYTTDGDYRIDPVGTGTGFEIFCDESRMIGGDDSAPPPLAFFAAALAF